MSKRNEGEYRSAPKSGVTDCCHGVIDIFIDRVRRTYIPDRYTKKMTDLAKRSSLLEWLYDRRENGKLKPTPSDFEWAMNDSELARIARQLRNADLVRASFVHDVQMPHGILHQAWISGHGADVIEGNVESSVAIIVNNDNRQTLVGSITGGSAQFGDNNLQTNRDR